jgi:intracellular sulfur oxidation DsrE/DsrF family protein
MGIGSPELYAMSEATTGAGATDTTKPVFVTPRIEGYGAIMPLPQAAVPPQAGSRVVFDIAGAGQPDQVLKGLNSIASFLNLAAEAGIAADSFHLTAVLHGPATAAVLRKEAYEKERKTPANPNLALIRKLKSAGVELYVCGQALAHHRYALEDVVPEVTVAVSAVTVTVSKQMAGYAYLPYY